MTEAELLARSDANCYEAWRLTAANADGGETWESDGIVVAATGASVGWLNPVFVTRPLGRPEQALRRAVEYFDDRGLPFIVRVREGLDERTERTCEDTGLPYRDTLPGMALSPLSVVEDRAAPVEIKVVEDAAGFAQFVTIMAECFHLDPDMTARMLRPRLLDIPDSRWYLGYVDGQPAGAAALIMSHRVAGVHYVGTREAFRGRGIGEATTRRAVREGAAAGCLFSSLQASQMGRPVYERIGFRTITGYKTFVRPEQPEQREA